jgi:hypothetical protein
LKPCAKNHAIFVADIGTESELCVLLLQPAPTGGTPGICNANMPNNSVYTRFLYVIKVSP